MNYAIFVSMDIKIIVYLYKRGKTKQNQLNLFYKIGIYS